METKTLHISMAYTYVGDTSIEVPADMTLEEAFEYARDHIDDIPVAANAEYVPDSDDFEIDDCDFEEGKDYSESDVNWVNNLTETTNSGVVFDTLDKNRGEQKMQKNIVQLDICDTDPDYEKPLATYFLVNPDEKKLQELKNFVEHRFDPGNERNEDISIDNIEEYLNAFFEILEPPRPTGYFTIKW